MELTWEEHQWIWHFMDHHGSAPTAAEMGGTAPAILMSAEWLEPQSMTNMWRPRSRLTLTFESCVNYQYNYQNTTSAHNKYTLGQEKVPDLDPAKCTAGFAGKRRGP